MKGRAKIELDDRAFRKALKHYQRYSKRSAAETLQQQAKLLIRDVVRITPPNTGKTNKQAGDAAIRADIGRIMYPTRSRTAEDAATIHREARRRDGRIDRRRRAQPARNIPALRKKLLARVGLLASGWNAAASKLGVRIPGWITRHGNSNGQVKVRLRGSSLEIVATNRIRYAGAIKGLQRRINSALNRRARVLRNQVDKFLTRAAQRSNLR